MNALDETGLRRSLIALLIIISAATMTGRVLSVRSKLGRTPLLSANDRSRWSMIRALVDHGTFAIDDIIRHKDGSRDREWDSIDKVRHRARDGREHFYSSKPPLLATLVAGKYWLVKSLMGVTLADQPFYVVRLLLLTTNVVPMLVYFVLLACIVEELGVTNWGRLFVMATATCGTFLTTFAVTLNNHVPAAISVLVAVYAVLKISRQRGRQWRFFILAGGASAFAAANELPALSFLALVAAGLTLVAPRRALLAFYPALATVAGLFFGTNYLAHDSLRPPYAHRHDGPKLAEVAIQQEELRGTNSNWRDVLPLELSSEASVSQRADDRWVIEDPQQAQRWVLRRTTQIDHLELLAWDNWYEYEGSYWTDERRTGVDRGEESRLTYAFHVLLGHRGIFSLTPVWLLSLCGTAIWLRQPDTTLKAIAASVILLTLVCLSFYLMRPLVDRNYGGVATGFRWMFWFTPLWLIVALPAVDRISATRVGRGFAIACLAVSVISASYQAHNPWSQSWIFDYWTQLGWIAY